MSRKQWMIIGLSAAAAGVMAWQMAGRVFHHAPITTDEQSYSLQAHLFARGLLKYDTPPLWQAFRSPMVVLDERVGWFSRYSPGHALWLMPGVWMGSLHLMAALAAGLGLALTAVTARRLGASVGLVCLGFLLSPFFLFTYGTLMSHTSGMMVSALMLFAYVSWRQGGSPAWALCSGLAWAFLFLNRTYTALLMAIPFALDSLWFLWRRRTREVFLGVLFFAGAACSGIVLLLIYNYLMVGHPLRMTYLYYDPTDKLGFGMRHNWPHVYPAPKPVEHSFSRGVGALRDNLVMLDAWLFGFRGGLLIWLGLVVAGWKRVWTPLLVGSVVWVWVGYILFWYPGWNETGPNYYVETLPAMLVAAAFGVERLWRLLSSRPRARKGLALAAAALWAFLAAGFIRHEGEALSDRMAVRGQVLELLEDETEDSLVFIRPKDIQAVWRNHDLVFNPRGLSGPVVVARWLPESNAGLVRYFSGHVPKVLRRERDGWFTLERLDAIPALDVSIPISSLYRATGSNETDDSGDSERLVRVAREGEHEPGWLIKGRFCGLYPGSFRAMFEVWGEGAETGDVSLTFEIAVENGTRVLAAAEYKPTPGWQTISLEWESTEFLYAEPRAYYHGIGSVSIAAVRVMDNAVTPR